jgi:hypothetical protein
LKLDFNFVALYPAPMRLGFFILVLLLFWLPLAAPIYLFLASDPNLVTILTMGFLFVEFLFLIEFWGKKVHREARILSRYGLVRTRRNGIDLLNGLSVGLVLVLSLFILLQILGWSEWQKPSEALFSIVFQGLLSALGVGFAEELVFRGWLLDELERDYNLKVSIWADALIFALLHFLKPLGEVIRTFPQFPGLVLLGLNLVWAKRASQNRLGLSIGLHAGLVWGYYIVRVGGLVEDGNKVSPWITGVDGNPLAGLIGLLFLLLLAFWICKQQ